MQKKGATENRLKVTPIRAEPNTKLPSKFMPIILEKITFGCILGATFFGPIALLSIVGMPDQASRKYLRVIAEILDEIEPKQL